MLRLFTSRVVKSEVEQWMDGLGRYVWVGLRLRALAMLCLAARVHVVWG